MLSTCAVIPEQLYDPAYRSSMLTRRFQSSAAYLVASGSEVHENARDPSLARGNSTFGFACSLKGCVVL